MTLPDVYNDDADEAPQDPDVSKRSRGVALLLAFFGGVFGLHRFYVDKPRTGIAMIFTLGGLGIWYLYDLVLIAAGEFRDSDELPLRQWEVSPSPFTQNRLVGRAEQRVNEIEERLDALRQQFNDLAERVDFAERMLAQRREPPQLPRGS
ncbi:MAG TPA: TM2 domain-containing protein [Gemmatimonadales bacterium]|nr:TM2 domain-containing protein [Gemmatimonadales bacterium]